MFNIGKVILQSGDEFSAEAKINNVGKETADNMLLMFGTVTPDTSAARTPSAAPSRPSG